VYRTNELQAEFETVDDLSASINITPQLPEGTTQEGHLY